MSVIALASLGGIPAQAHDHAPPAVQLSAAQQRQDGHGYHVWWTQARGDRCVGGEAYGPIRFPPALVVPFGTQKARIRLNSPQRPDKLRIGGWRAVDPTGAPLGPQEPISYELRRRSRDGRVVAWVAVFDIPEVGHYYLQTFVTWKDRGECGGEDGGWWAHHLEVSPI